jgi:precorrin-6Y C5,15-methyltransferase (decarboxylating)
VAEEKIRIVGIGDDGMDGLMEAARVAIENAAVLVGTGRCLAMVPEGAAKRVETGGDLDEIVSALRANEGQSIVIVTSGDPLFYGLARYLCDAFGKERFEVVPHVSSMQLAFARVKEPWEEAYLANLASVDLPRVVRKVRSSEKAGLFTTEETTPARLAQELLRHGIDYFTAYVCENLGSPNERVTQGELADLAAETFAPLNVVILIRKPNVPDRPAAMAGLQLFGNPDEVFLQSQPKRGLLTPMEVRIIALSLLDLGTSSIVWDVGAGSGSVSIEAARLAYEGTVFAIEMEPQDHQLIVENAERFGVRNVQPTLGQAPDVWADLPDPDAVFIGGAGRAVATIAEQAWSRLRAGGRLVVNVNSIDNLNGVLGKLKPVSADVAVRMINIAEATTQLEALRFESKNPSFLISVKRQS